MRPALLLLALAIGSGPAFAAAPTAAAPTAADPAAADPAAADACAAKLDPDAKSIYTAAAPAMAKPGADMRAVLTKVVAPKVMHGDMTRKTAEPLAREASECLALMQ